jgi:hypothetical protein
MTNIFGNRTEYACKFCNGTNVSTEFSVYRKMNEEFTQPTLGDMFHQDQYWCSDCDEETYVIEKVPMP